MSKLQLTNGLTDITLEGIAITATLNAQTSAYQNGNIPLSANTTTIPVTFSLNFPSIPTTPGAMIIKKANSSDDNIFVASIDSVTVSGFNVNLSGPSPVGAILYWSFSA